MRRLPLPLLAAPLLWLALLSGVAVACGGPEPLVVEGPSGGAGGASQPLPMDCDVDPAGTDCSDCRDAAEASCSRGECGGIASSLHACAEAHGCIVDGTSYDQACLLANCPAELGTLNRCILGCYAWGLCGGYPDGICDTEPDGIGCATCEVRNAERCDRLVCSDEHAAWNGCVGPCADAGGVVDQACEAEMCPAERDAMYGCEADCNATSTCTLAGG